MSVNDKNNIEIALAVYKQLEDIGYLDGAVMKHEAHKNHTIDIILSQIDGRYNMAALKHEILENRKKIDSLIKLVVELKTGAKI